MITAPVNSVEQCMKLGRVWRQTVKYAPVEEASGLVSTWHVQEYVKCLGMGSTAH